MVMLHTGDKIMWFNSRFYDWTLSNYEEVIFQKGDGSKPFLAYSGFLFRE